MLHMNKKKYRSNTKKKGGRNDGAVDSGDNNDNNFDNISDVNDIENTILKNSKKFCSVEKQYRMAAYDVDGIANRYLDIIIIFGYMTFFVSVLPCSFAIGLISMLNEVRGDLWLMLHRYQRPIPQRVESIGMWASIMELMIIIAVITNAAVVIFTMPTFNNNNFSDLQRMGIFIFFQYAVFLMQYIIGALIPDYPSEVIIQRQRETFIVSKLIEKESDNEIDPYASL